MCHTCHGYTRWILTGVLMGILAGDARAGEVQASIDGKACARGMVVLRVTFPSRGEVWRVALNSSINGEDFGEAGVGLLGTPDLFTSVTYHDGETTILVPAAGWFGSGVLYFDGPGTQWFRWTITFRDQDKARTEYDQRDYDIEPLVVEQMVQVKPAQRVDLDFIARVGEVEVARTLFGRDPAEGRGDIEGERYGDAEVRAARVISVLLRATRADDPGSALSGRTSMDNVIEWAKTLAGLAKEFPESSYAPYAAYYAGCCYLAVGADVLEKIMKEREIQDSSLTGDKLRALTDEPEVASYYLKAQNALTLAADRADLYLKPRAIYLQAGLVGTRGEWDEMERLLDKALAEAPGKGTIRQLVDGARRDLARVKEREQRHGGAVEED